MDELHWTLDTGHVLRNRAHKKQTGTNLFFQSILLMFFFPGVSLSEVVHHGQQALLQASCRPFVYLCSLWVTQGTHHCLQQPGSTSSTLRKLKATVFLFGRSTTALTWRWHFCHILFILWPEDLRFWRKNNWTNCTLVFIIHTWKTLMQQRFSPLFCPALTLCSNKSVSNSKASAFMLIPSSVLLRSSSCRFLTSWNAVNQHNCN